uniref:Uncharacterized protein n=1 Tax=Anguilla anguilla TaxID=7936 RepID=A0A0E9T081_ANGAN
MLNSLAASRKRDLYIRPQLCTGSCDHCTSPDLFSLSDARP